MTEEREVVERYTTAVLTHDDATVQALLHPDVVVYEPPSLPYGGEHRGLAVVAALAQTVTATWELVELLDEPTIVSEGERVIVMAWFRARAKHTGTEFDIRVVEAHRVKEGLITETVVHYWDTAGMLAAFGLPMVATASSR